MHGVVQQVYYPNLGKNEFGINLVSDLGRDKISHQVLSCALVGRRVPRMLVVETLADPWLSTGQMEGLNWWIALFKRHPVVIQPK